MYSEVFNIWNNENNIVLNMNMKYVWHFILSYLMNWKDPLKYQEWHLVDLFTAHLIRKLNHPLE
jgi:hypothetical protein